MYTVCVYLHVHVHVRMYTHIIHIHVHVQLCVCVRTYEFVQTTKYSILEAVGSKKRYMYIHVVVVGSVDGVRPSKKRYMYIHVVVVGSVDGVRPLGKHVRTQCALRVLSCFNTMFHCSSMWCDLLTIVFFSCHTCMCTCTCMYGC